MSADPISTPIRESPALRRPPRRGAVKGGLVVLAAVALIALVDALLPSFNPFSSLFRRETTTATGDVVLKQLKETRRLDAATGSFEVPVVVCNGEPEAFVTSEREGQEKSPSQQLQEMCNGFFDEKATLLVSADVSATVDLERLADDAVRIDEKQVEVVLPPVGLGEPRVDAEEGLLVVAIDTSIFPGGLPDDYQARAAGAGKDAVARVADGSDLRRLGEHSARSLFEGLLRSLGFTDVTVRFAEAPAPG